MIPSFKNSRFYDWLKFITLVLLPAAATAIASLAPVFGLTADQVTVIVGALTSIGTILGSILSLSSKVYAKEQTSQQQADLEATLDGAIFVTEVDGDRPEMTLGAEQVENILGKDVVHLKVVRTSTAGPLG